MLEILLLWVDVVQNHIGVPLVRSSEDDYFEQFIAEFETFFSTGSDVKPCTQNLSRLEVDG